MIDIHSHILPGLDDGSRDIEESIQMAEIATADGISQMVVTPHMYNGLSHNPTPGEVARRVAELQDAVGDKLELLPGSEVHLTHDMATKVRDGCVPLLNGQSYMLVELPSMNVPVGVDELLYQLQLGGITPIVVHPERNAQIQRSPSIAGRFIERGARIQVTAMSITGEFGVEAKRTVETLLRHEAVHFIATDTHRATRRPPILSAGRDAAAAIVGGDAARRMVEDNPAAVIRGESFDVPMPKSFDRAPRTILSRFFAGPH